MKGKISYREFSPSYKYTHLAYCYWSLHTAEPLTSNFDYVVLPDACVDLVFSLNPADDITGILIMTAGTSIQTVSLDRQFHYIGIRLYPDVLHEDHRKLIGEGIISSNLLSEDRYRNVRLLRVESTGEKLVKELGQVLEELIISNHVKTDSPIIKILNDPPTTVSEFASKMGVSDRQLRRTLPKQTGFNPKSFLNVLKIQRSLQKGDTEYADQAHYIRNFRKAAKQTPLAFRRQYGMSDSFNT